MALKMALSSNAKIACGIVFAAVVVVTGFLLLSGNSGDSPVELAGGSIHAITKQAWTRVNDTEYYATYPPTTDLKQIFNTGVQGITSPVTTPDGWVITISNRDKNKKEKEDGVRICSDEPCDFKLDPNYKVFAFTRPDSNWELIGTQELHFHDQECDQAPGSEDRTCDYLFRVRIDTAKDSTLAHGRCKRWNLVGGWCKIGIGK